MGFEGWKRNLFKFLEKKTCDNSTFIEVESHNIRNFSIEEGLYLNNKSSVIWNGSASGVDLTKFDISKKELWRQEIRKQYGLEENDIVFVFAGRLTADKGVNELLEAFLNIQKENTNVRLFMLGGMDNAGSLAEGLFEQAKKTQNIIFTGSVENVEQYYAASDVFVAPSYREGFGLVVIEAESMGLPAIVSDVPGQIDAIVENKPGLSCIVKNSRSLQKSMEIMINDKELREKMGNESALYVENNYEQKKLFQYLKGHRDALISGGE